MKANKSNPTKEELLSKFNKIKRAREISNLIFNIDIIPTVIFTIFTIICACTSILSHINTMILIVTSEALICSCITLKGISVYKLSALIDTINFMKAKGYIDQEQYAQLYKSISKNNDKTELVTRAVDSKINNNKKLINKVIKNKKNIDNYAQYGNWMVKKRKNNIRITSIDNNISAEIIDNHCVAIGIDVKVSNNDGLITISHKDYGSIAFNNMGDVVDYTVPEFTKQDNLEI